MPFQSMPYAPPVLYQPRSTESIADLIARRGDIMARRAEQGGALWGQALANIGNVVAGAVQQRQEQKEQSKRDAALSQFIDSGAWQDPKVALAGSIKILGPRDGPRFAEGLIGVAKMNTAQDPAEAMKALPMVARGLLAAPDTMKPGLYGSARTLMINAKLMTPDQLPEQWSPELEPVVGAIAGQKEEEGFTLSPGAVRFDPTGKQIAAVPAAPKEEKKYTVTVPGPGGRPIKKLATEEELAVGVPEYREPEKPKSDDARVDRAYQYESSRLTALAKPVIDQAERFSRLVSTVNQRTPQADALIAPELLTVMAGGMGSGLRMNEAEISRIIGGRSKLEDLKAALNKWTTDPTQALSVTDAQRDQIKSLISEMNQRIRRKVKLITQARQKLVDAEGVDTIRQVMADMESELLTPEEEKSEEGWIERPGGIRIREKR